MSVFKTAPAEKRNHLNSLRSSAYLCDLCVKIPFTTKPALVVEPGILPGGNKRAMFSNNFSGRRDARPLRQARRPPLRVLNAPRKLLGVRISLFGRYLPSLVSCMQNHAELERHCEGEEPPQKSHQTEFFLPVAVCAWCRPGQNHDAVTHGICPRHMKEVLRELPRTGTQNGKRPKTPAPQRPHQTELLVLVESP